MSAEISEGSATTVTFDRSTIELDALQRAAYALADAMTVDISVSGDRFACTLYARHPADDKAELAHDFRTEVIDQTLRLRIAGQTESIRNLIFALAFSRTGLVDDPEPEE